MPRSGCQHVPRHDVGVVLHLRQHDDVALLQVGPTPAVGDEVETLGGVLGEDQFIGVRCVDEALRRLASILVRVGCLGSELVRAAVDRRVRRLHEASHRVDDRARLLRGVGRIEIHQRLAVDLAMQHRELLADGGDVEAHRNAS